MLSSPQPSNIQEDMNLTADLLIGIAPACGAADAFVFDAKS